MIILENICAAVLVSRYKSLPPYHITKQRKANISKKMKYVQVSTVWWKHSVQETVPVKGLSR